MITLIDTSSLVVLARYYQPFDTAKVLYSYIEKEVSEGRMIILDKVAEEAKYTGDIFTRAHLVRPDDCIGCGLCESACPIGAVRLQEKGKQDLWPATLEGKHMNPVREAWY